MMKHIRLISALALSALLLTACGAKDKNSNTSEPNAPAQTTGSAPDTSNDTFSVDLLAGLLGVGEAGLAEQMGTGTELRDSDDNELEGYRYEGVLFGETVTAEADLNDSQTVEEVDVYFNDLSVEQLRAAVNDLPKNSPNEPQSEYDLDCERDGNRTVLEISRD